MSQLNDAVIKATTAMLIKFNNRLNKSQRESEAILRDWASYLAIERKFTVSQIGHALSSIMSKGVTFMPSAYEIEAELRPATESHQDKAPQVAIEILNAIRTYGPHAEVEMLEKVSEEARLTLLAIGYTGDIRNSENYETTKAQIERLARGVLASREALSKNSKLESIGIETGKVLNLRKPEFKTVDYSGFLNGDLA